MALLLFVNSAGAQMIGPAGPNYILPTFQQPNPPIALPLLPGGVGGYSGGFGFNQQGSGYGLNAFGTPQFAPSMGAGFGGQGGIGNFGASPFSPIGQPSFFAGGGIGQNGLLGGRSLLPPAYPMPGGMNGGLMYGNRFGPPLGGFGGMGAQIPMFAASPMMMNNGMRGGYPMYTGYPINGGYPVFGSYPTMGYPMVGGHPPYGVRGGSGSSSMLPMLAMMAMPLLSGLTGGSPGARLSVSNTYGFGGGGGGSAACPSCTVRSQPIGRFAVNNQYALPPAPPEDQQTEAHVRGTVMPAATQAAAVSTETSGNHSHGDRVAMPDSDEGTQTVTQQPQTSPPTHRRARQSSHVAGAARAVGVSRRGISDPERERLTPGQRTDVVRARNGAERSAQRAPVWPAFIQAFRRCAPGCAPAEYASYGSRPNPRSCHPLGRALDVGSIICEGKRYKAINGGRFAEVARCVGSQRGMKVLYQNGNPRRQGVTGAHYDHAHFSIGCHGGTFW